MRWLQTFPESARMRAKTTFFFICLLAGVLAGAANTKWN
jgi:hypothetical protein